MRHVITLTTIFIVIALASPIVQADSDFAATLFQQQWQAGEAITPNFWGLPHLGSEQEDYKEAFGGKRLVQYFDKGRMELTNDRVTNGLLSAELIKGRIQVGNDLFQAKKAPPIPIAGDVSVTNVTYAAIATKGAALLLPAGNTIGKPVATKVSAAGDITKIATPDMSDQNIVATFDDATKHNVPKAFADYRTKAGLATIGLAISEPFHSDVRVAGAVRDVIVQVFERRVLTYSVNNPDPFKVEMGNVGIHYQQWRYAFDGYATTPPELQRGLVTTPLGPPLPGSAFP